MAAYSEQRTQKALPIGSVQPWVGPLTRIPRGWLLCNGAELTSTDYPLLARIIKDTYGGANFSGNFPNYTGTFRIPPTNQRGLADIDTQYFSDTPNTFVNGESVPRPNYIDNATALNILRDQNSFIDDDADGSLGAPTVVFAVTDLLFSYQPDPDGFISGFSINSGNVPVLAATTTFSNVPATGSALGTGATFKLVIGAGSGGTPGVFELRRENTGEGYEAGEILDITGPFVDGDGNSYGTSSNKIEITIDSVGDGFFSGAVDGQSIINGFEIKPVYIVGRKLSRQHFPQHYHEGSYRTLNKNDSGNTPGAGVCIYQNAEIDVTEFWDDGRGRTILGAIDDTSEPELDTVANVWSGAWTLTKGGSEPSDEVNLTSPFTQGVGRYAIAYADGDRDIPASNKAFSTAPAAHGVGKEWFYPPPFAGATLRDGNGNTSDDNTKLATLLSSGKFPIKTRIPFSDDTQLQLTPNFDDGGSNAGDSEGIPGFSKTFYNTAGRNYNVEVQSDNTVNDVILPHDHNGSFNIEYDDTGLNIKPSLQVEVVANVTPDNLEGAFQITYTVPSPSLSIIHLIRAY